MSLLTSFSRQRSALVGLTELTNSRAIREVEIAERHRLASEKAHGDMVRTRKKIESEAERTTTETANQREKAIATINAAAETSIAEAHQRYRESTRKLTEKFEEAEAVTQSQYRDKVWAIDAMLEAHEKEADTQKARQERLASDGRGTVEKLWERAEQTLAKVNATREAVFFDEQRLPSPSQSDPVDRLGRCLEDSQAAVGRLERTIWLSVLKPFSRIAVATLFVAVGGGLGYAMGGSVGAAIGSGSGLALGLLTVLLLLRLFATQQVVARGHALGVFLAETMRTTRQVDTFASANAAHAKAKSRKRHQDERKSADDKYVPLLQGLKANFDEAITRTETIRNRLLEDSHRRQVESLARKEAEFDRRSAEEAQGFADRLAAAEAKFEEETRAAQSAHDRAWAQLESDWHGGLQRVADTLRELQSEGEAFPAWDRVAVLPSPTSVPLGVRFGELSVCLAGLEHGIPSDARLMPKIDIDTVVPAFLPFPDGASVVLKAKDAQRAQAIAVLQMMMLRFLTGLPAGKVRFTIIDPVGLGENFGSFMHLADADEQLVTGRIWTEPGHIEARLADLTGHMETVIQKYLRNQYVSIEEYNRAAGEVAEAYRVLVIANFPTNFTPEAAKRLISIVQSGPSCGVCTMISVDTNAAMPRDFRLADLEAPSLIFTHQHGRFQFAHPDFAPFPLVLDPTPDPKQTALLVKKVGEASKSAGRVEVPFSFIAPAPGQIGKGNAAKELAVPVGRAGATRKQIFRLGVGTAQHALVAGKTGSGKSTLLHAFITNLALHYGPSEVELYLIDFKKGVEFKSYATHRLPHARVIAIESEREFGLSVLQRLDAELRDRGDRFRAAGANDLAGYRELTHQPLPRVLLIVDEFQEFFVEDDKLAQEASLLLDRLVRQGRAFGMHVILGSQTLGGAYSLARSTIDQMAIRIALQCSDADAQLILNKDNTAARLLSRPGEAIYNDANGLVEGNDPFQVVWLDEQQRDEFLRQVREQPGADSYPPALVFEGTAGADIAKNQRLMATLRVPATVRSPIAWLGDPVAIKDPTQATFRTQSAANLLVMGQHDDLALSLVASAVIGLCGQTERSITILDGTPEDGEYAGYLTSLAESLGLPAAGRDVAPLGELAREVTTRLADASRPRSARFVVIFGLQRFRELRKSDDDFGFGRKGEKAASPSDHFSQLLKDGPSVGIHAIVWVDSLTNFNRSLERSLLKEFGQRVLFQMSATDSSNLLDTPAASRLGRNRALFTTEELDRPEKFRPYALPGLDWVRRSVAAGDPNHPDRQRVTGSASDARFSGAAT
jgi:S-DNA-T family DNA segregation ATPase FtsK/SpoIIIE